MERRTLEGFREEVSSNTLLCLMLNTEIACFNPVGDEKETDLNMASTFSAAQLSVLLQEHCAEVVLVKYRSLDVISLLIKEVLCPKDLRHYFVRCHQFSLR